MVQYRRRKTTRAKKADGVLVSVITPAFNSERTLANAINSVLTQTHKNLELIVVDDGSVDSTEDIVKRFHDKRIKYYKRNHEGLVSARNFGNSKARGVYCTAQDADDFSFPDRIEKCLRAIGSSEVLVHGLYVNVWSERYQCMEREYRKPEQLDLKRLRKQQYLNGVCFYKRSLWKKYPFRMETEFAYDWMMHLDWALNGAQYVTLDEGLYDYIRYQGSASDQFERLGLRQEAFKEIKKILKNEYASH